MVLLTSSAISVAISSGIVFLFTFLLFLSGYVLQQQTVKSLQEALQAPVEVRVRLQQGYQNQFETAEDVLIAAAEGGDAVTLDDSNDTQKEELLREVTIQAILDVSTQQDAQSAGDAVQELTPQQLWHAHVDGESPDTSLSLDDTAQIQNDPIPPQIETGFDMRLAYVLSLPNPSDLCSALLFTKWHRKHSSYPRSQFNIIYLYPSDWETSSKPIYKDALNLLLEAEHHYSVLLHPVQISKVWTGIDVKSQLLSELARNPWVYDRVLYLRSPGMLVDTPRLDEMFVASYTDPGVVKTQWTKLRAPVRRGDSVALHPDILLFAQGRGLMVPVGGVAGSITAKARIDIDDRRGNDDAGVEVAAPREAAYILFDDGELETRRKQKAGHDGLLGRFEREREKVCEGTMLLP